jgi:hypothetical protein
LADGWIPTTIPHPILVESLEVVRRAAEKSGRDPMAVGLHGRVAVGPEIDPKLVRREIDVWESLGASFVSLNPLGRELTPQGHIELVRQIGALD